LVGLVARVRLKRPLQATAPLGIRGVGRFERATTIATSIEPSLLPGQGVRIEATAGRGALDDAGQCETRRGIQSKIRMSVWTPVSAKMSFIFYAETHGYDYKKFR
jgi:hypothetical protein